MTAASSAGVHRDPAMHVEHGNHLHGSALPAGGGPPGAAAATLLVVEYVSGGGFTDPPPSLLREGVAMRDALLRDLARIRGLRLLVPHDRRYPPRRLTCPLTLTALAAGGLEAALPRLAAGSCVWLIAPESGGCLARLAAAVQAAGGRLAGSPPEAIGRAVDKVALAARLEEARVPVPRTWPLEAAGEAIRTAGFPLVVKPSPGAGCGGVRLVESQAELERAGALARARGVGVAVQEWCPGQAASAAVLVTGGRALPLVVAEQVIRVGRPGRAGRPLAYGGGALPLRGAGPTAALAAAARACESVTGLAGWIGVDVVLGPRGPVVIELNPRLTTSYAGVRAATPANLARLALRACDGRLPSRPPEIRRRVRFRADGRVRPA